ncbi:APH(3') family aminoglycoside O-phosphotransferase [Devosia aurantiaca]|uniref:Aminoglycoside 3'-phosphotransferase n=1 Tax=Devosia aurantiaca TaxID=2714858 RepID=A0A6M1SCR0_9HYPH|nr:APH(3') family aminoglycoside O-phosphotransferase [Devosia aurantiaca]NGP17699.1 aminoglycoside 3'-phosphotransferase [Devosia aurantiaca]
MNFTLPPALASLAERPMDEIAIGESGASVWRIELSAETSVFLKSEPAGPHAELPGEIERLNWLTRMGFKAPRVVEALKAEGRHWLLMPAVPGEDLTHYTSGPAEFVRIFAQALKRIHALDPRQCPFDHSMDARLAAAKLRVDAGLVDETDFDDERAGWPAQQVLDWLYANRPAEGIQIVTHGDASTPNIMALDGRFSGFIDCGRVGTAGVWQDLALACRSIIFNIGEAHIAPFLAAYGAEWDEAQYRFYCALDELF